MLKIDPTHSNIPLTEPSGKAQLQETASVGAFQGRPKLTPPSEIRFLNISNQTRDLGNTLLDTLSTRLSCIKDSISEISLQNIEKLKDAAEKANSSQFWTILQKVATALLSSLSSIIGISLVANGGSVLVGGAMIASGVLSLANFGLNELKAWDWVAQQLAQDNEEKRKELAIMLPAAAGILCAGIGLAGSAWSVATNSVQFTTQAVQIAQSTLGLFSGMTTLGKGCADARLLWTQADLAEIQGKLTVERAAYTSLIEEVKGSLITFRSMNAKAAQAIKTITASNILGVRT